MTECIISIFHSIRMETIGVDSIEFVQFSIPSAQEYKDMSVCHVTKAGSFQQIVKSNRDNTLFDERMGSIDIGEVCMTCGENEYKCPGHFGHIELAVPVYNKLFHMYIKKLLKSICFSCYRLRIQNTHLNFYNLSQNPDDRLGEIADCCKGVRACSWPDCGAMLPDIDYSDNYFSMGYTVDGKSKPTSYVGLSSGDIYQIFKKISDETIDFLRFNAYLKPRIPFLTHGLDTHSHRHKFRPENMIFTIFPVIPPCARPPAVRDDQVCDDDLVDQYNTIIKDCEKVTASMAATGSGDSILIKKLHESVWSLISDDKNTGIVPVAGRVKKTLKSRLKDKEGRLQGNIGGKRVNYSSRAVIISGGLLLKDNELGVPEYIASRQLLSDTVTPWNIGALSEMVRDGRVTSVLRKGEGQKRLDAMIDHGRHFKIKVGDVIDRKLSDGDDILFNRQPTIRMESFQHFKVKVVPGFAFRLGLSFVTSFNADFDGDEMNGHIPQSPMAIEEARVLYNAGYNLVSTQSGKPCNGLVQDALVGLYLLTNHWKDTAESVTRVSKETFMWIVSGFEDGLERYASLLKRAYMYYPKYIRKTPHTGSLTGYRLSSKNGIPGQLLVSILFPPTLTYTGKTGTNELFPEVLIRHGVMLPRSGPLCKKSVGTGGFLLHAIWHYYSSRDALRFTSMAEHLVYRWIPLHGFSIGPSHCFVENPSDIDFELNRMEAKTSMILAKVSTPDIGKDDEAAIGLLVGSAIKMVGMRISKETIQNRDRNAFNICGMSGAKGTPVNLIQTACFLGQQDINGGRVPLACRNKQRTLPCYGLNDRSLESRGFVYSNYIKGLNAQESFFHAMAGRKGIIASAIKTSTTGYIEKCMSRKMEDLVALIDGSVRDANGNIIEFFYGGDGMDPRRLERTPEGLLFANLNRILDLVHETCIEYNDHSEQMEYTCGHHSVVPMTEDQIDQSIGILYASQPGITTESALHATQVLRSKVKAWLQKIKVCELKKATLIGRIKRQLECAIIAYGSPVGLIAGSNLGAPVIQLTLNTFRQAGVRNEDSSGGIPRFKEILNVTKTKDQKKPSCIIHLRKDLFDDVGPNDKLKMVERMEPIMEELTYRRLSDYIRNVTMEKTSKRVLSSTSRLVKYKKYKRPWWFNLYCAMTNRTIDLKTIGSWVVKIELDPGKVYKQMNLIQFAEEFNRIHSSWCIMVASPLADAELHVVILPENLVLEKYMSSIPEKSSHVNAKTIPFHFTKYVFLQYIQDYKVSGVETIRRVYPIENPLKKHEWYLDVKYDQVTLKQSVERFVELMARDHVDTFRSFCDDIYTIQELFGIEAAQEYAVCEICRILSFNVETDDIRHIILLVKTMSFEGEMSAATRNGIDLTHQPISQIMFECPAEKAVEACIRNEMDPLTGSMASVMFGFRATQIGTGAVTVVKD